LRKAEERPEYAGELELRQDHASILTGEYPWRATAIPVAPSGLRVHFVFVYRGLETPGYIPSPLGGYGTSSGM